MAPSMQTPTLGMMIRGYMRHLCLILLVLVGACNRQLGDQRQAALKLETRGGIGTFTFPAADQARPYTLLVYNPTTDKKPFDFSLEFSFLPKEEASSASSKINLGTAPRRRSSAGKGTIEYVLDDPQAHGYDEGATYRLHVPEKDHQREIEATALTVLDHAAFLVETTLLDESAERKIRAVAKVFDEVIYPRATALFGTPSDINGDEKIAVLFTSFHNRNLGGFFNHIDLLPENADNPDHHPNLQEILYLTLERSEADLLENLAHELQHLLFFSSKYMTNEDGTYRLKLDIPYEERGINEGLSHFAEDVLGYGCNLPGLVRYYLEGFDGASLQYESDEDLEEALVARAGNYLFIRYLFDRLGGGRFESDHSLTNAPAKEFFSSLAASRKVGYRHLAETFSAISGTKTDLADLIADFFTAMTYYGSSESYNPRFQFAEPLTDPVSGLLTGVPRPGNHTLGSGGKGVELEPVRRLALTTATRGTLSSLGARTYRVTVPAGESATMQLRAGKESKLSYIVLKDH